MSAFVATCQAVIWWAAAPSVVPAPAPLTFTGLTVEPDSQILVFEDPDGAPALI